MTSSNIKSQKIKNILLRAIADERARKILTYTIDRPMSVMDIVKECDIPHTTAYRIVNELKEKGILFVERIVLTRDGKKYALYRSAIRGVEISFIDGTLNVRALPNEKYSKNIIDKAFELFFSLRGD